MPDLTVSSAVDTLMQSSNQAGLRSALALGNSATLDTGTTAGTVATGDHTHDASAITGGTLDAARLPTPGTTTLGGVKRNAGSGGQFVSGIDTDGGLLYGTPTGGTGASAPVFAEVASDVAITDNATFQDITGLSFSVAANKKYRIDFVLSVTTSAGTTGYELGLNGPASPTRIFSQVNIFTAQSSFVNTLTKGTSYGSIATNINGPSTTPRPCVGTIYFQNGANAGTLQFQGKVETAVSGTLTFQANSAATITELA